MLGPLKNNFIEYVVLKPFSERRLERSKGKTQFENSSKGRLRRTATRSCVEGLWSEENRQ